MELEDFRHNLKRLQKCDQIWDEMKPVAGGRHCQKCSKRIVDFSRMTYTEMAYFMSEQAGPTCGFYLPEQLPHYDNKKKTLPAAIGLTALLSAITIPQVEASSKPVLHIAALDRSVQQETVDKQASDAIPAADTTWVHGVIHGYDSTTKRTDTLAHAAVFIKGTDIGVLSDKNGAFRLGCVPKNESGSVTLVIANVGYITKIMTIDIKGQVEKDLGLTTLEYHPMIEFYVTHIKISIWRRLWNKMTRPFRK